MLLYAATGNLGKLREFVRDRGANMHIHVCPCYAALPECPETGATFEANARLKAEYYSRHTAGLVFADDSGLEVDALGGAPGVHSARYSGAGDAANNAKLLAELVAIPPEQRGARYVCVIALAHDGHTVATFRATAEGRIIDTPRGAGGFGYDPYFLFPELGLTFAEIPGGEKWIHSHRGKAFREMLKFLNRSSL
jgi:XTP/dITP diphosphohydrolase